MSIHKHPFADLRRRYPIHLEVGFVAALAVLVLAFQIDWAPKISFAVDVPEHDDIKVEEIQPTDPRETPPPPPKPRVPVAVPDDVVLEEDEIDFGAELERGNQIEEVPPPLETVEGDPEPEPFYAVEQKPEPIGGMQAIYERAKDYPEMAVRAGVEGRVFVEFIVDADGHVRDARVLRGVGAGLDELALKAIQETRFEPGKQRGKPVPVKMSLAIQFKLK